LRVMLSLPLRPEMEYGSPVPARTSVPLVATAAAFFNGFEFAGGGVK